MIRTSLARTSRSVETPEEHVKPRTHFAEMAIGRIIDLRALMPKDKTVEEWWAKFELSYPRNRDKFRIKYALLDESITAVYATSGWLEDHFHCLSVATDQRLSYRRTPFNVDCQSIASNAVYLNEIADISANPEALMALSSVAAALASEKTAGWPNLVSPGPATPPN